MEAVPLPLPESSPTPLLVAPERAATLKATSADWPSLDLTPAQAGELELLLTGALSPLNRYLSEAEVTAVTGGGRLADGTALPAPVVLPVRASLADGLAPGQTVALREGEGVLLAALTITEVWTPTPAHVAAIPALSGFQAAAADEALRCIAGTLEGLELPPRYAMTDLHRDVAQLRAHFAQQGKPVVALLTDQPVHCAELAAIRARIAAGDHVWVVGLLGDDSARPDPFTLVRCLREAVSALCAADGLAPAGEPAASAVTLSVMPAPSDAALRPLIAANGGARGNLPSPVDAAAGEAVWDALRSGAELPEALTPPGVAAQLRRAFPPPHERGLTLFFTGFSGSGKSTVANIVCARLREIGGRAVTLLDGDLVRKNLSSELGFSREHRNLNIQRIGFVASEITRNGGLAVCAPIAPYAGVRRQVRQSVEAVGAFFLVWVCTPLHECERRDRKGLYAKARAGIIKEFTGISDPYEEPDDADLKLDTTHVSPAEAAEQVITALYDAGYLE